MKPSDFTTDPMSSIFQKSEYETIARNIMVILERKGNRFRKLKWEEYKEERVKDGNYSYGESMYFDKVVDYCKSERRARTFSPVWGKI